MYQLKKREFSGSSYDKKELDKNLNLKVDYIVAPPRMAFYMKYSTRIYNIYLKYVAPEDIHVYSIDEVFIDVTSYLNTYRIICKRISTEDDIGCAEYNGNYSNRRNRNEFVFG